VRLHTEGRRRLPRKTAEQPAEIILILEAEQKRNLLDGHPRLQKLLRAIFAKQRYSAFYRAYVRIIGKAPTA